MGLRAVVSRRNNVLDDVLRCILPDGFCVQPESLQVLYWLGWMSFLRAEIGRKKHLRYSLNADIHKPDLQLQ